MIADRNITFIGGGHIAEIILYNLVQGDVIPAQQIFVCDPSQGRREHISTHFGVSVSPDNVESARKGNLILICVRPEIVNAVLPDLQAANLRPDQVLISVAAGVPLNTYRILGDQQPLVRALPNPPSQVGQGIAPLVFSPGVTPEARRMVLALFSALGEWVEVEESYLNAITSLSSPVATYLFFQSLIDAGVACGLPDSMATQIAAQTIIGSMALWKSGELSPSELITQASTPGGVSVKSLQTLEEHDFKSGVVRGIVNGAARAAKLGEEYVGKQP